MNNLQKTFVAISNAKEWMPEANCRNMDTEMFFAGDGQNYDPFIKEVCRSCPVTEECLWYANESSCVDGVFGGMTPRERMLWRRKLGVNLFTTKKEYENRNMNYLHTNPSDWRER